MGFLDPRITPANFDAYNAQKINTADSQTATALNATYAPGVAAPLTKTYNTNGTVATFTQGGITYTVGYDSQGRKSTVTGGGKTVTYNYNASGQLTGKTVA